MRRHRLQVKAVQRELFRLPSGKQVFVQILQSAEREPTHMLVFLHGYNVSSEQYLESMSNLARQGALVILPDLPGHGRTDGDICYVTDWWAFIDEIWEILDFVVPKFREGRKPMKVFGGGMSMGGGIIVCLAIQRPGFFEGIMTLCPMLFVSDELKPSWLVTMIFKHLIGPAFPSWPITPSKEMAPYLYRLPEQGLKTAKENKLGMQSKPARIATAYEFAFRWPEWVDDNIASLKTPFLVLHGDADKVTDPKLSQRLYDQANATDKQIRIYPGVWHCELLTCLPGSARAFDWQPEQLKATEVTLADMADWIAKRL
eukprot:TRINITY_DN14007_c0_g1_i2.p1 TRINITY_DN14007_c0_g1~~TRINITY_DN14007_c0_g1_i2.p1  ORF type:complete len:315 (+),score=38.40 TRINITY_DN14007_c0_g1_i2:77-1021(+)